MKPTRLGRTGLSISPLILGCMSYGAPSWRPWVLDEEASRPFFRRAIELGFTTFDTADMYSLGASEEVTGRALKEFAKRDEVVIATKVFWPMGKDANAKGLSRKHIMAGIDASLKRLGTDHVDLHQIHRFDPHTPIEETLEALNDVVRAGKALYIGASSMWAWQFMKMLKVSEQHGWAKFVSMQPQLNLLAREEEREMLPLCLDQGVGVIPWSPLARGWLAGDRKRDGDKGASTRAGSDEFSEKLYGAPEDYDVADAVSAVAKERGVPNMQVALAWVLSRPAVSAPIIGATKPHHLEDAVAALSLKLEPEEIARLEKPYRTKPVLDHA